MKKAFAIFFSALIFCGMAGAQQNVLPKNQKKLAVSAQDLVKPSHLMQNLAKNPGDTISVFPYHEDCGSESCTLTGWTATGNWGQFPGYGIYPWENGNMLITPVFATPQSIIFATINIASVYRETDFEVYILRDGEDRTLVYSGTTRTFFKDYTIDLSEYSGTPFRLVIMPTNMDAEDFFFVNAFHIMATQKPANTTIDVPSIVSANDTVTISFTSVGLGTMTATLDCGHGSTVQTSSNTFAAVWPEPCEDTLRLIVSNEYGSDTAYAPITVLNEAINLTIINDGPAILFINGDFFREGVYAAPCTSSVSLEGCADRDASREYGYQMFVGFVLDGVRHDISDTNFFIHTYDYNDDIPTLTCQFTDICGRHTLRVLSSDPETWDKPFIVANTNNAELGTIYPEPINDYYDEGDQISLVAVPAHSNIVFQGWSNGATENPLTYTVSASDSITALFAAADAPVTDTVTITEYVYDTVYLDSALTYYQLTVTSANTAMGFVAGNGSFPMGTPVEIAAIPVYGYRFTGWNDNNNDNPRHVSMDSDMAFEANFEAVETSISNVEGAAYIITSENGNIIVNNASESTIRIFDQMGRCISLTKSASESRMFVMPATGTYYVQVGSDPAQKVLVVK